MAGTTGKSPDATAIRPLTGETLQADLDDLRAHIEATRWPEKEPVEDQSQGVQVATMQALARYWATDYELAQVRGETGCSYKGGHVAAWEEPELFSTEVRAAFRPLR